MPIHPQPPDERELFAQEYRDVIEREGIPHIIEVREAVANVLHGEEVTEYPTLQAFLRPFVQNKNIPLSWLSGEVLHRIYENLRAKRVKTWRTNFMNGVLEAKRFTLHAPMELPEVVQREVTQVFFNALIDRLKIPIDTSSDEVQHLDVRLVGGPMPNFYSAVCEVFVRKDGKDVHMGPIPIHHFAIE